MNALHEEIRNLHEEMRSLKALPATTPPPREPIEPPAVEDAEISDGLRRWRAGRVDDDTRREAEQAMAEDLDGASQRLHGEAWGLYLEHELKGRRSDDDLSGRTSSSRARSEKTNPPLAALSDERGARSSPRTEWDRRKERMDQLASASEAR